MDGYAEIWQRFAAERRLEFGGHMDPKWQDGHMLSASLMVPLDASSIRERLEPPREALRPFQFVSLHPDHFMHVTLFLLGFLVPEPEDTDEISPKRLTEIEMNARQALADFPTFEVVLANLNAFPGAAFIELYDGGMLNNLRDALRVSCGLREPPGPPHLTLAYFQAPDSVRAPAALISAVERYREWPVGKVTVKNVELTLLDLRSDYPEPQTLAKIPLNGATAAPLG
jgi:2'-5' RNA ligase